MKILNNGMNFHIENIHFSELNLVVVSLKAIRQLLDTTKLDSLTDNQEKASRIKEIDDILQTLTSVIGSQSAESWDETIIRKVIEKYLC
ncbi:MAG: hypothetical protein MR794_01580 [Bacteroidales bacterium]|nr:hypothetical protein [Bacteroidales bacterium]